MILAILLLACPHPPLFDMSGPVCTPERQVFECECSECATWDPIWMDEQPDHDYRVWRRQGSGQWEIMGRTRPYNSPGACCACEHTLALFEAGETEECAAWQEPCPFQYPLESRPFVTNLWCFARDREFPVEGETYFYAVDACDDKDACSVNLSNEIAYTAAPYACWINNVEVACYEGDELLDN